MAFQTVTFNFVFAVVLTLCIAAVSSSPVPVSTIGEVEDAPTREGRFYGGGFANAQASAMASSRGLGYGWPGIGFGGSTATAAASASAGATGLGMGFPYGK